MGGPAFAEHGKKKVEWTLGKFTTISGGNKNPGEKKKRNQPRGF